MLKGNSVLSRFICFQLFLIIILMLFGSEVTMGQKNFNGGFEIKSLFKNEPVSWFATRVPQTKDFVVFAWDSTEHHSGSYSVSITIDSTHPQDEVYYNWTRNFENFEIGKKYSISGWIKTENLKRPPSILVQCWDESNNMKGFFTTQKEYPIKGNKDWTLVKTDFIVPEGTATVTIRAGISAPVNNGGKVWFDDIKIE